MNRIALSLCFASVVLAAGTVQTDSRRDQVDALLSRFVSAGKIAGAVAGFARNGKVEWVTSHGYQNLETRSPMTASSLFRIYSMTKAVTAVAVMQLIETGPYQLNDPVSKYLPEFRTLKLYSPVGSPREILRAVTVQDLLLHTSGLSHRTSDLYQRLRVRSRDITLDQFIGNITAAPLMEEPGTVFRYSESTTVLGRLVEVWSGKPFDEYLEDRVFQPLRMADTGFHVTSADRDRLTTVYRPGTGGRLDPFEIETVPFTERPRLIEGAVGLVSTVPDYLRFCQMLLNLGELDGRRVLRPDTVERMTTSGLSEEIQRLRGGPMGWGLANVNVLLDPAGVSYAANRGEYGWDGTAGTIFWIDPASKTIAVLMTQISPSNPDQLRQQFKRIISAPN